MKPPAWEHFAHEADIGIRGCGETLATAFEQAAVALSAVVTDPRCIQLSRSVDIHCSNADPELLLVDWLNELIYEMAVRKMLFGHFHVEIEGNELYGQALGESIDIARHHPAVEVKGATYTALAVHKQADGGWCAECVVDV